MRPIRATEIDLQYASEISPWWLLLVIPAVLVLAWSLYGKERGVLSGLNAVLLPALRYLILAGIAFLAFRPSLILREILTYPGRVLLVMDDSESMSVNDTGLDEHEAVRLYRRLRGPVEGVPQPLADLAETVRGVEMRLRRYQPLSRTGDRKKDSFWERTEEVQTAVASDFEKIAGDAGQSGGTVEGAGTEVEEVLDSLELLRVRCNSLFTGNRHAGSRVFDSVCADLAEVELQFLRLQAAADDAAGTRGRQALMEAVREIRGTPRLNLAAEALANIREELPKHFPGQAFRLVSMMEGKRTSLAEFDFENVEARKGETDIVGRCRSLLTEENDFPVTAVVVISDGRDLSDEKPESLTQTAVRKRAPVYGAMAGDTAEPNDVAIVGVVAPPYALKGREAAFRVRLKTAVPEKSPLSVRIRRATQVVSEKKVTAADGYMELVLPVSPAETGLFRYSAEVESETEEVVPRRNNAVDFCVGVREEKIRVLFLDWKPRWETRFALNIFRRLDYVELNDIIVLAGEKGKLVRGSRKGTWPQDMSALRMYDLLILGEIPPDLLGAEEWRWIGDFVSKEGKSCFLLGAGAAEAASGALGEDFIPVNRQAEDMVSLDDMCLTGVGALQPLTRRLSVEVETEEQKEIAGLYPQAHALLLDRPGGRAVLSVRYAGEGKIACLESEKLWKRLNPSALAAHGALYVNLAAWCVDADTMYTEGKARELLLESHVLTTRQGMQVWIPGVPTNTVVEAVAGRETVARSNVEKTRPGAALGRAVFNTLPAGTIRVRVDGDQASETEPIEVVERYPEMHYFARKTADIARICSDTGGKTGSFADILRILSGTEPKQRIEKKEEIFRLWDSGVVLALIVMLITVEWVWRKLAGLV
ncbi:MAG: hypothetical protein R6V03_11315 [Kiritimatiellia bacterium]